jgi:hypothetical protein
MTTDQEILATLHDIAQRLGALETAVAGLTGRDKQQSRGISFESVGGKKVGHPLSVRTEKEIDFSAIGGKCVLRASEHPTLKAKPETTNEDHATIS